MQKTQMIDNAVEFFEGLPAFSFVFLAPDMTNAVGPNLISAIELTICTLNGRDYEGPYPESEFESQKAEAEKRRVELVEAVESRLRHLRKSGVRFIMCWQAFGEREPHMYHSRDYAVVGVQEDLRHLLQEEMFCHISV